MAETILNKPEESRSNTVIINYKGKNIPFVVETFISGPRTGNSILKDPDNGTVLANFNSVGPDKNSNWIVPDTKLQDYLQRKGVGAIDNIELSSQISSTSNTQSISSQINQFIVSTISEIASPEAKSFLSTPGNSSIPGISALNTIRDGQTSSTSVQPANPGQGQQPQQLASSGGLRYPLEMTGEQDTISFRAVEYAPRSPFTTRSGDIQTTSNPTYDSFSFPDRSTFPRKYSTAAGGSGVTLAIQSPISDLNSVDWSGGTINAVEAFGVNKALELIQIDSTKIPEALLGALNDAIRAARSNQKAVLTYFAQEALSVQNLQSRLQGQILNPNLELLFSGPQLRPFNFSFKLSAREPAEAVAIRRIINYFKYHMAPRAKDKLFLKAPYTFQIKYNGVGSSAIGQIKECALLSFGVDYTPLGSYATYEDGTMVQYNLNMQFQELEPVTDIDQEPYKDSTTIGY